MANGLITGPVVDINSAPNPPAGKYIWGLDTDGILRKKDSSGVKTPVSEADLNDKVKISANDTTEDFLLAKLQGSTGRIVLTEENDGGNESIKIDIGPNIAETFAVDLDSADANVTRVEAGGRTTFTITHGKNTLDVISEVYRLSDGRSLGWRVERTGLNTVEASRAGSVANGLFRIVLR